MTKGRCFGLTALAMIAFASNSLLCRVALKQTTIDAATFTWKSGLKDENGRLFEASELKDWRGERSQAGRIVPRGWAKSGKFSLD